MVCMCVCVCVYVYGCVCMAFLCTHMYVCMYVCDTVVLTTRFMTVISDTAKAFAAGRLNHLKEGGAKAVPEEL